MEEADRRTALYNRLYDKLCVLSCDTIDDFLDGNLSKHIKKEMQKIVDEYVLPPHQRIIILTAIEISLKKTNDVLKELRPISYGRIEQHAYITKRHETLLNSIIDCFPLYEELATLSAPTGITPGRSNSIE